MKEWEAVIGLEIHVELATASKLFCGCSTAFGAEANTQVCPVCLGLPGHRPILNRGAIEYAIKASLALNCDITPQTTFDRKNYFYADLPKGFQISQFFYPTGTNGYIDVEVGDRVRRIGIRQIHVEEDTGKLVHLGDIASSPYSLVDFNRAGVPLIEIVTQPDIRTAGEARLFLQKLRSIIEYTGVSDCKMEEGSMRCDANISVRPPGSATFGTKTELKNMNSFRAVQRATEYEIERQIDVLSHGEAVIPQTRHWDEAKGITVAMRAKYLATDYRCFPDPNIIPMDNDPGWVESIRQSLPELPDARIRRMVEEHGLPGYDAETITSSRDLADFYEATVNLYNEPKVVSNWIMGEVSRCLNAAGKKLAETPLTPRRLAGLLQLIAKGTISGKIAKGVFEDMFASGQDPEAIVQEKGLVQIADTGELGSLVTNVLAANPKSVADFKAGKEKALGFLVGQIMKETRGKANPQLVNQLIRERIEGM
ncbi:MAG: Asp-tRNA(Asn)/Glu-tRNA(Gln) amidotransferase subunit GatB [Bacillota bacterium]